MNQNISSGKDIKQKIEGVFKKPNKRKIMETMSLLEDQLEEIKAEEGYIGSIKAQQRLRDNFQAER